MSVDRADVWRRLGAPTDQEGSVNEPRIREEFGAKWNEKWIYRGADGKSVARVVLWLRYDLTGIFRIAADASAESEAPPGASCEAPPEASFEALTGG